VQFDFENNMELMVKIKGEKDMEARKREKLGLNIHFVPTFVVFI